jgi:hypothetical protein
MDSLAEEAEEAAAVAEVGEEEAAGVEAAGVEVVVVAVVVAVAPR